MTPRKVGQPRKHIIYDSQNNIVDGLSYDEKNNTYFVSYKDEQGKYKKFNCGRDKLEAIANFRSWQAAGNRKLSPSKQLYLSRLGKGKYMAISTQVVEELKSMGLDLSEHVKPIQNRPYYVIATEYFAKTIVELIEKGIPAEYYWNKSRTMIFDNPILASQKLRLPFLADPDFTKTYKPKKSYTLSEIGQNYFSKVEFLKSQGEQKKELEKVKRAWAKFVKTVSVKTINELTKDRIKEYYQQSYKEYKANDYSSTWLKGHFERVIRVFNAAINDFDEPAEISNAKLRCSAVLKSPKNETKTPAKKIPKEIFWRIIGASNDEEKAMWLLSINLAYYTVDIATLPLNSISLQDKTVIFRRGKTGQHRAGILFDESIQAIKTYQQKYPHNGKTLFFNCQDCQPYVENRIRKKFVAVLEKLEQQEQDKIEQAKKEGRIYRPVNFDYTHSNFRDSFESVCAANSISQRAIDGVMGHKGIADKYTDVESTPEITAPACKAVWEYYFGKQEKTDQSEQKASQ